jgi:hypothetical protein
VAAQINLPAEAIGARQSLGGNGADFLQNERVRGSVKRVLFVALFVGIITFNAKCAL